MTDENVNTETVTEGNTTVTNTAPVVVPSATPTAIEKTLTQTEVNNVVGAVRKETAEKVRRDVMNEMQVNVPPTPAVEAPSVSSQPQASDEQVRGLIKEEAQKMAEMQSAQQVVSQFVQKMENGKEGYEDFDETVEKLNLPTMPHIIHFANSMPNTADIMYELGKNPAKVASLMNIIQYTPQLANQEFTKLSNSIVANKEAANAKKAKEPLSQVESSYTGIDNGEMSVSDMRKQKHLR